MPKISYHGGIRIFSYLEVEIFLQAIEKVSFFEWENGDGTTNELLTFMIFCSSSRYGDYGKMRSTHHPKSPTNRFFPTHQKNDCTLFACLFYAPLHKKIPTYFVCFFMASVFDVVLLSSLVQGRTLLSLGTTYIQNLPLHSII